MSAPKNPEGRELWILQNAEDSDVWEKEDKRLVSPVYRSTNYEIDGMGPCDIFVHVIERSAFDTLMQESKKLAESLKEVVDWESHCIDQSMSAREVLYEACKTAFETLSNWKRFIDEK